MTMLALVPVVAFGLAFFTLGNARPTWGWDRVFLRSAIYFATYAVLGAEVLGLFHALTLPGLAALWLLAVVLLGVTLARRTRGKSLRYPRIVRLSTPEAVLATILGLFLVTTAVIAYLAPPNTWDSLTYHMARVAHWAQAGSIDHYATGIERQNLMPPGAEIGMLHAYVLAQGDRLVNFPQWLAMAASLVGAGAIARLLGASRLGQIMSAVFVVTLPMGIAQASSTMTDYVVAVWMACVAFETISLIGPRRDATSLPQDGPGREPAARTGDVAPLGLAAGLAVLAKPTAFAYLAPFAVVVAVVIFRRRGPIPLLAAAGIALGLVLLVNAGYFGRNIATYGNPLGNRGKLETHSNEVFNGKVFVSNVIRNAGLHAGTPWDPLNDVVFRGIIWIHLKLGMDLSDPRTTVHEGYQIGPPVMDEKRVGNPFHAATAILASILLVVSVLRRRRESRLPLLYLGLVVTTFLLLSSMFKFSVFASRYHLPFFVLVAPAVGFEAGRWKPSWLTVGLAGALAVSSLPALFSLNERPLLEDRNGYSVATTSRSSLYFMTGHSLEGAYNDVAERLDESACASVGIMLSGDAAEYPLWPLLGAAQGRTRLEWIVAGTPSARYIDPSFEPCAVICDGSCPDDWTTVRGLPVALQAAPLRLYMAP